jgi:HK97 family phage prohead protease
MTRELISRVYALEDVDIQRVDRKGREVSAYATVFDIPAEIQDRHGHYFEQINRAAFNRTISRGIGRVRVFYNHGYDLSGKPNGLLSIPVATPKEIKPDTRGLITVSRYNDGEVADAILAAWEGGEIKGQSFTGSVYSDREVSRRRGLKVVERTELSLKEYGPTHSPAYEDAGLIAIRSQDDLAELVRSMITSMVPGQPAGQAPSDHPDPGPNTDVDSLTEHSSRIARARLALKRRRLTGDMQHEANQ